MQSVNSIFNVSTWISSYVKVNSWPFGKNGLGLSFSCFTEKLYNLPSMPFHPFVPWEGKACLVYSSNTSISDFFTSYLIGVYCINLDPGMKNRFHNLLKHRTWRRNLHNCDLITFFSFPFYTSAHYGSRKVIGLPEGSRWLLVTPDWISEARQYTE